MRLRMPDQITLYLENAVINLSESLQFQGGRLWLEEGDGLSIHVESALWGVEYIKLRWQTELRKDVKCLGDAWERGYGDLSWKPIDGKRTMPWYMALSNRTDACFDYEGRFTECFGVGVQPNVFALWNCDETGVTLTLDLRNGCKPIKLADRRLYCATVYFNEYRNCSAFDALSRFCKVMCTVPNLPDYPIYGSNNWYYAYGNSSHNEILEDARFVSTMCKKAENKPYMVIDDGWQLNGCDAPWDRGNERFPDMKGLADEIKELGARPGIWVRYLINGTPEKRGVDGFEDDCYLMRDGRYLDPSHPAVLDYVKKTTKRLCGWGYTLIKHDYSTFDIFGKWGFQMSRFPAEGDWHFYDQSKTSAEIVKNFYLTVQEAAPDAVIIGCNTIGHLCAGIHQLQRTGDDTSGYEWARTLKMGVNTLAFRLVQNRSFFIADADCAGITPHIPWEQNREWLKLLARSGSCLFVSCKSDTLQGDALSELEEEYLWGSKQSDLLYPIDWMENVTPERYMLNGKELTFNWNKGEA